MKSLISTTTALALVLGSVPPFPLLAQTDGACVEGTEPSCPAVVDEAGKAAEAAEKAARKGGAAAKPKKGGFFGR